ncbi:rab-GTPase-TBC domain-containing protein [Pelagophyceae sp. CCMP2097]|nr:rab-GTPase-TBC domain-containing protein [Pelagophyceae sp. CCMP2097]|mmetsp:Transcript_10350/g.34253  ORF Transcript_10350/g.34253 Transcript_10350/m.34253 type:complete len:407 (-) Transcript_10350:142-1362(-)
MARTAAPKCDAWGFYLDELKWAALPQSRRWLDSLEAADEQRDAKWTKMTSRKGLDGMCQNARLRSTLKRRIRKGVPRSWRRAVWPKLIGLSVKPGALAGLPVSELQDEALKSGKTYAKLCAATAGEPPPDSINEIIERDLCRTFPRHALFDSRVDDAGRRSVRESEKQGVTQMRRLLRAYAEYDSALGYCQGMNYVASVLIIHVCGMQVSVQGSANDSIGSLRSPQAQKMQPGDGGDFSFLDASSEEATFWLFVTLVKSPRTNLRELWMPGMIGARKALFVLEGLLSKRASKAFAHMSREGVEPSMYATHWVVTLFSAQFPFALVTRVWDAFFAEGWKAVYRVAVAIISAYSNELLLMDFEKLMHWLRLLPETIDAEKVLKAADKLKLSQKDIDKLDRAFDPDATG